jgi:hypothetical protein
MSGSPRDHEQPVQGIVSNPVEGSGGAFQDNPDGLWTPCFNAGVHANGRNQENGDAKDPRCLRLRFENGPSESVIAHSLSLSNGSVNVYLQRARMAGLHWPLPEGLDDTALAAGSGAARRVGGGPSILDWTSVEKGLRRAASLWLFFGKSIAAAPACRRRPVRPRRLARRARSSAARPRSGPVTQGRFLVSMPPP